MNEEMKKPSIEEVFIGLASKIKRKGIDKLMAYLKTCTDFFKAPASTRFHGNYEGGLIFHSINVYQRLVYEVKTASVVEEYIRSRDESLRIVALFHDLCKANTYKVVKKNQKCYDEEKVRNAQRWQIKEDAGGKYIWDQVNAYEKDEDFPFGHGEKSVYILQKFIDLTDEEAMAIRWHMGGFDCSVKGGERLDVVYEKYPLAFLLHIADLKATYIDEQEFKNAAPLIPYDFEEEYEKIVREGLDE